MHQSQPSRPPPADRSHDPLAQTWPEDPHGTPLTERQAEYVLAEIDRFRAQLPTEEELRYLKERHEEERRWRAVKDFLREHWPRAAMVLGVVGVAVGAFVKGIAWLAAYNVTITHK